MCICPYLCIFDALTLKTRLIQKVAYVDIIINKLEMSVTFTGYLLDSASSKVMQPAPQLHEA